MVEIGPVGVLVAAEVTPSNFGMIFLGEHLFEQRTNRVSIYSMVGERNSAQEIYQRYATYIQNSTIKNTRKMV